MKDSVDAWDTVDQGDLIYDPDYGSLNCLLVIPDFEATISRYQGHAETGTFSALGKPQHGWYMTAPARGDALVSSFNLVEPI